MKRAYSYLALLQSLVAITLSLGTTATAADGSHARRLQTRVIRGTPAPERTISTVPGAASAELRSAAPERRTLRTDWCDRFLGGPRGSRDFRVDLSAAVATTREFSVASVFHVSDNALVEALHGPALKARTIGTTLETYASALDDVCAGEAGRGELGPATVQQVGPIAFVRPGIGQPVLPRGTALVAIDLRDLPAVAGLDAALARAVAPALATPVTLPARWLRGHDGPADEFFVADSIYSTFVTVDEESPLPVWGNRDLPLVLLTGRRMAPATAAFAGALRMTRRAWIVGDDVLASVAEADWRGVAGHGLAIRTRFLDQFVRTAPQVLRQQRATQDDPNDPSTSGYRRDLEVGADSHLIDVSADGPDDVDIDLYLMRDANADGVFTFPDELIESSATATAHERIRVPVSPGRYQVWVHGWSVPAGITTFDLQIDLVRGQLWPDVIPADLPLRRVGSQAIAEDVLHLLRTGPGPVTGPADRSFPQTVDPFGITEGVAGRPELRAALLIVHGSTRLFFPYFATVGDRIDERLIETLDSVESWDGSDRNAAADLLRRFGEALHDGHQFVFSLGPADFGYLPAFLEEVDGRPVVRRSSIPEIHAGDTILSMNGRHIEDIYADEYRIISTASHGYQFDVASRYVSRLYGTTTLELADPNGALRRVTIEPQSADLYLAAVDPLVSPRPSGPLADLGAPTLYYLNMNSFTSPQDAQINAAIADAVAHGSTGLIVDMRGYPNGDIYDTASRLINDFYLSPQFIVPLWTGPDRVEDVVSQFGLGPVGPPSWNGPLVLLTGPHAVSASENFQQMLVGSGKLTAVVGVSSSAGTNGSLTGIWLPGAFGFTFTGTRILNPDGSQFHGIGIVPTIRTSLSAADLRDGIDRDILAAIDVLGGTR
jgi:hypothetical protein